MDMWDLKKWRRGLGYSQFEAAEKLGVSRGAIQHWECERNPIPRSIDLACEEIARRWKQRPEFGPVLLVYGDAPMWPEPDSSSRALCMQCELHLNNDAAIWRAYNLSETPTVVNFLVMGEDGGIVFTNQELSNECDKRRESDT